jgi:hypothetical protein
MLPAISAARSIDIAAAYLTGPIAIAGRRKQLPSRGDGAERSDLPSLGIGKFAPGIDGFRRSHQQAQRARSVAIVRRQDGPALLAATDPGLSLAALLAGDISEARDWVGDGTR